MGREWHGPGREPDTYVRIVGEHSTPQRQKFLSWRLWKMFRCNENRRTALKLKESHAEQAKQNAEILRILDQRKLEKENLSCGEALQEATV